MFSEDLAPFLADFGIPATAGAASGKVILDMPDRAVLSGRVQSTEYAMTFITADFPGLKFGDSVTVNAINYRVLSVELLDDGALSTAELERV